MLISIKTKFGLGSECLVQNIVEDTTYNNISILGFVEIKQLILKIEVILKKNINIVIRGHSCLLPEPEWLEKEFWSLKITNI